MIGGFRERVGILAPQRIPDAGGGYEVQYIAQDEVFSRTETLSSRSDRVGGRYAGQMRRRFTMRYRPDLSFDQRLSHDSRTYRIMDIQTEDDRKRFHIIVGEEVLG